ncbi:MAG: hypothetical protein JOZ32_14375 [Bryobacterales bacterium]|nr:hypothetical protein [Bryobacterales bacterium]
MPPRRGYARRCRRRCDKARAPAPAPSRGQAEHSRAPDPDRAQRLEQCLATYRKLDR